MRRLDWGLGRKFFLPGGARWIKLQFVSSGDPFEDSNGVGELFGNSF